MHDMMVGLVGLMCALLWLVLLVVTSFNTVVVSGGLLAALYIIGGAAGDIPQRPGNGRKIS